MRRGDRRPAQRPLLRPTLTFGADAVDDYTRALAAALVARYSPACAWEWACAIDVVPGIAAGAPPLITLRFRRHVPGATPDILNAYEITWREVAGEPVANVGAYAALVLEHVADFRRNAVLDYSIAWRRAHEGPPDLKPSPV